MDPQQAAALVQRLGAKGAAAMLPQVVLGEVTAVSAKGVKLRRQDESAASAEWYLCLKAYAPSVGDVIVALLFQNMLYVLGNVSGSGRAALEYGQRGEWAPGSSALERLLLYDDVLLTEDSGSVLADGFGRYYEQSTGTASGGEAHIQTNAMCHERQWRSLFVAGFRVMSQAKARLFAGLTSETGSVMVSSDDPAGSFIGLQKRADEGHWHFVSKDGSTLNRQDTGVDAECAAGTDTDAVHVRVEMANSPDAVTVKLLDYQLGLVASHTFTANLPALDTALRVVVGIESTEAGTARAVRHYFARGVNHRA